MIYYARLNQGFEGSDIDLYITGVDNIGDAIKSVINFINANPINAEKLYFEEITLCDNIENILVSGLTPDSLFEGTLMHFNVQTNQKDKDGDYIYLEKYVLVDTLEDAVRSINCMKIPEGSIIRSLDIIGNCYLITNKI